MKTEGAAAFVNGRQHDALDRTEQAISALRDRGPLSLQTTIPTEQAARERLPASSRAPEVTSMTPKPAALRRVAPILLAGIGLVTLAGSALAQRANYLLFTDPQKRYSVEFPKDWQWLMVSGSGEPLVTFIHPRKEAAVVVERYRMRAPLGREQITDIVSRRSKPIVLKENQPRASDVASKMVTQNGRRLILIDYLRPGIDTRERGHASTHFLSDKICIASPAWRSARSFRKHESTFDDRGVVSSKARRTSGPPRRPASNSRNFSRDRPRLSLTARTLPLVCLRPSTSPLQREL